MDEYAPRLPAVLGATAALVAACVSLMARVPPLTCVFRAVAAFALFAAFGIVIRYILASAEDVPDAGEAAPDGESGAEAGASVEEWIEAAEADERRKGPG